MNTSNIYCFLDSGKFNINKEDITGISCNICLDDLSTNQSVIKTPCSHLFHSACIKEWLNTKIESRKVGSCPFCRSQIGAITSNLSKLDNEKTNHNQAAQNMLQRAKTDIENMIQGRSHPSFKYILEDLKFASQHGLSAESLPLEAKVKLERAKTDIENIIQGEKYASLKFILED